MIERLGSLVLVVGIMAAAASAFGANAPVIAAIVVAAGLVALVPVRGLSIVDRIYSVLGPLSAAWFVLAGIGTATVLLPETDIDGVTGAAVLAVLVIVVAVPLYASAIAGLPVDLYRFGYAGWRLPVAGLMLLAAGSWLGAPAVAVWLLVAGVMFLAGLYTSRNLFDYLVDPAALVMAMVVLADAAYLRFAG